MSKITKNFLIALCVFIAAKLTGYLLARPIGTFIAAALELIALVYFIMGLISYRSKKNG